MIVILPANLIFAGPSMQPEVNFSDWQQADFFDYLLEIPNLI